MFRFVYFAHFTITFNDTLETNATPISRGKGGRGSGKRKQMHETLLNIFPPRLMVKDYIQSEAHQQLSLDVAMATAVLLKNNKTMGMVLPITNPVTTACVSTIVHYYLHFQCSLYMCMFRL